MKVMIVGQKGREDSMAAQLEGCELHVFAEHRNPGLVAKAEASGGKFWLTDDICAVEPLADYVSEANIDMLWVNADEPLAAGIVDAARAKKPDLLLPCPDREAARIEWDKFDTRQIISEIDDRYNPRYKTATTIEEVKEGIRYFSKSGMEIAVKPCNLTAGKGVKVMGPHLDSFDSAEAYALKVLKDQNQTGVLLEEKLEGREFTVQGFTDGHMLIVPPATYDYPYREDGDTGPGTGGMGCFTMSDGLLPFISESDYQEASRLMERVLLKIQDLGRDYKGTLYGSFFKTAEGLKVVEFNARQGDPEAISIFELLRPDVDMPTVLKQIALGELQPDSVRFQRLASTVIYLVSPDYTYRGDRQFEFELDVNAVESNDCRTYFSAAEQIGHNLFRTVGASRTVAMAARAESPWGARDMIKAVITEAVRGPLTYRQEIASQKYINNLQRL